MITFQEILRRLSQYWEKQGCIIHQGYDLEVGAGTMNPATALRCLGPEPYRAAYIEPSRRPTDGRYGTNPNRLQRYYQYQVILKPSPLNMQELYVKSLEEMGFDLKQHDIRFVHDDWENPTIGAWGLGWEVWLDGMEVTQYTYFQCMGGVDVNPVTGELTYGIERLAMYLQKVDSIFDLQWDEHLTYGDIYHRNEVEFSKYNFEEASVDMWRRHFDDFEKEAAKLLKNKLPLPAYDFVLKSSHAFNMLDARGAISVSMRTDYISRIRDLARQIAEGYVAMRESLDFPLIKRFPKQKIPNPECEALPEVSDAQKKETFLLEIGSEELPATFVPIGLRSLESKLTKFLKDHALETGAITLYGTPRRIAIEIRDLPLATAAKSEEKRGPSVEMAFSGDTITPAGAGFFRSIGKNYANRQEAIKEIQVKEIKGIEYLFATLKTEGKSTGKLLQEALPELILSLDFPKKMRWSSLDIAYARPLKWIVALLGSQVIPFKIGPYLSGNQSLGHAQLDPAPFTISNANSYLETLKKHFVLADQEKRKRCIEEQIAAIEKKTGGVVIEKEKVLSQVLYLAEWPELTHASFDTNFLKAPKEVLISEMVDHQKYFPVTTIDGDLMNLFVITADNTPTDQIRSGNKKVLSSRLNDGVFLYDKDLAVPLDTFYEKLKTVSYIKNLGTLFDKTKRLEAQAVILQKLLEISTKEEVERAARFCKIDLVSDMVYEFPELQGIMGYHLALHNQERSSVAEAIREHYMPLGETAPLPETDAGIILSIADKIDNLLACFSESMIPTSSSDPFALRRQVLGIIKILIQRKQRLSLRKLLTQASKTFESIKEPEAVIKQILDFFENRVKTVFLGFGFTKDEVEASLSFGFDDIYDLYLRVRALNHFRTESGQYKALYEVFKRAKGQLNGQEKFALTANLLKEPAEIGLHQALNETAKKFNLAINTNDYNVAYGLIADLQPKLAKLFDEVKILTDDPELKQNRIALLQQVFTLFELLLDFSKLKE